VVFAFMYRCAAPTHGAHGAGPSFRAVRCTCQPTPVGIMGRLSTTFVFVTLMLFAGCKAADVEAMLRAMSLRQKIGQLITVRIFVMIHCPVHASTVLCIKIPARVHASSDQRKLRRPEKRTGFFGLWDWYEWILRPLNKFIMVTESACMFLQARYSAPRAGRAIKYRRTSRTCRGMPP
jgi:hypothetical protein